MKYFPDLLPAAGIFCLALFVRIVYNLTVGKDYIIEYDAHVYYAIAVNLKNSGCYCLRPQAITYGRAPAWPYLMFLIFSIMGSSKDIYARLFLSVLGSGTCVMVYLWARAILGRRTGLAAGTIATIYPGLFIYDGWLYSESVYTFFLTVFAYALYRIQWNGQCLSAKEMNGALTTRQLHLRYSGWAVVAGVTLALAAFARPNGTILIPVVFVWAFIAVLTKMVSWRIALRGALMVTLLSIVLIAPWAVRNYQGTHMFIPIATGSGVVLAGAYNDAALDGSVPGFSPGMWIPISLVEPPVPLHGHACCDYTGEQDNTAYALHWIHTHLYAIPYLLSLHFIHMWIPYTSENGLPFIQYPTRLSSRIVSDLIWTMTPLILLLAGPGLILIWKRKKGHLIVSLILFITIAQNVAFYGSSRFRAPVEPLLVLLAGGALWWLMSKEPGTLRYFLARQNNELPDVVALPHLPCSECNPDS